MQYRKLALALTAGVAIAAFFAFDLGQYLNLRTLNEDSRINSSSGEGYCFNAPGVV